MNVILTCNTGLPQRAFPAWTWRFRERFARGILRLRMQTVRGRHGYDPYRDE